MTTTNNTATVNASRISNALDAFPANIRDAVRASAEESVRLMLANGWKPTGDTYEIGSMPGDQQTAEERIGRKLDRSEVRALELTIRAMLAVHAVPGPRFCACGRIESDCDQSRASCSKADPASEDEESDIVVAGRQVPFVQVGMIVHPDDCPNCERDGNPLWCSALVCDIRDDDETARFGMMATLLFRNGERREEPCDELRRRWRLARDFDQARVYTGRWGAIPRGSVWPVAEVCEEA